MLLTTTVSQATRKVNKNKYSNNNSGSSVVGHFIFASEQFFGLLFCSFPQLWPNNFKKKCWRGLCRVWSQMATSVKRQLRLFVCCNGVFICCFFLFVWWTRSKIKIQTYTKGCIIDLLHYLLHFEKQRITTQKLKKKIQLSLQQPF